MKIPTKEKPPLPSLPSCWPTDNHTRRIDRDDVIIVMHPQCAPHKYDPAIKKWSLL